MSHLIISSIRRSVLLLKIVVLYLVCSLLPSCKKYLAAKSDQALTTPSTLNDLQALLDNYLIVNYYGPSMLEALSDDYYISTTTWQTRNQDDQLTYLWNNPATDNNNFHDWNFTYENPIYYSNVVLSQLPTIQITPDMIKSYNAIEGTALFYRAFAFYELAQLFCPPYSSMTQNDLGIVLRLSSNINIGSTRSSVEQTYTQILKDLKQAALLLPSEVPFPTRPNKASAFGAIARTYLSMGDYINAGLYADSCLRLDSTLIDYNTLSPGTNPVFSRFNPEVIFYNHVQASLLVLNILGARVDSTLYGSYDNNDLRKSLYYKVNSDSSASFYGSYEGSANGFNVFDGITTDEMYLISSECYARNGNITKALNDLNNLLTKRWVNNTFTPYTAVTPEDALNLILTERRKELAFRGLRWTDVRRLNKEGASITITRIINGIPTQLPPNDLKSVALIPQVVINLTGLQQNPR